MIAAAFDLRDFFKCASSCPEAYEGRGDAYQSVDGNPGKLTCQTRSQRNADHYNADDDRGLSARVRQARSRRVRIPVDVVQSFRLMLSAYSIRCCPPIPVEVVHWFRSEVVHFFGNPGMLDNIAERWTTSRNGN
jgi:hypothetical protein